MDSSRNFVTKLVDEGRLNEARRSGITRDFLDEDSAPIFNFIERHFQDYKKVASREAVKRAFPNYEFANANEPLEYYINELKESYRRCILEEKLEEFVSIYQRDTIKAESVLRETLSEIQVTQKTFKDISVQETADDRFQAYLERKEREPVDGIKSEWHSMDNQTLGFHPEEFIVLAAEKYVGKSWFLIDLARKAALQGERALFVTNEMSSDAIIRRLDSLYANVKFDSLRKGELTEIEEQRYKEAMEKLHSSTFNFIVAREGIQTIEDIETKAIETDATIIFGDSIYLFPPDKKSSYSGEVAKRLAVSQKCKQIARNIGVPFIVTVQAGRRKTKKHRDPELDDIEWSNAFSQDGDTVFFVEKTPLDVELKRRKIHLLKSRDGDVAKFYTHADFEYMRFDERQDTDEKQTHIEFDDEGDDEIYFEEDE